MSRIAPKKKRVQGLRAGVGIHRTSAGTAAVAATAAIAQGTSAALGVRQADALAIPIPAAVIRRTPLTRSRDFTRATELKRRNPAEGTGPGKLLNGMPTERTTSLSILMTNSSTSPVTVCGYSEGGAANVVGKGEIREITTLAAARTPTATTTEIVATDVVIPRATTSVTAARIARRLV